MTSRVTGVAQGDAVERHVGTADRDGHEMMDVELGDLPATPALSIHAPKPVASQHHPAGLLPRLLVD
jgi:hypothetical protein